MKIANPIYDVVFKYMMDDKKIAKLLISKIIGQEVIDIDFQPQESTVKVKAPEFKESFTVFRLDFAATIQVAANEYKRVIIEIQKAKLPTDILRFRKYLASQYASERQSFPIISIYFLGHTLEHTDSAIIKVARTYQDVSTGQSIAKKEVFIESLTHDSYVIQIPYLEGKRRNELEVLLSIFDQSQKESNHILYIQEEDYPQEYGIVIRKLQKAMSDKEVENAMDIEDEVIQVLGDKERQIANLRNEVSEKNKELSAKDEEIERLKKLLGK